LAFGLVGAVYFTWAARLPAVKADLGLSDGQLAVALIGLEVGALVGLQIGGVLVPRTGSRAALTVSLPLLAALLVGPGWPRAFRCSPPRRSSWPLPLTWPRWP
jgi:hypothetical protein